MKLKEQKKFGILWLSIGAALFLAGLLLGETEYGSYIGGFGGGLTAVGLVRLLRVRRLSRDPERRRTTRPRSRTSARRMSPTRRAA